mgnify:FL=1
MPLMVKPEDDNLQRKSTIILHRRLGCQGTHPLRMSRSDRYRSIGTKSEVEVRFNRGEQLISLKNFNTRGNTTAGTHGLEFQADVCTFNCQFPNLDFFCHQRTLPFSKKFLVVNVD